MSLLVDKPLVSVLTPCLNNARFIERCIESVLAQNYPCVEMIVQDGSSTDGTVEILKRYAGRIDWVSEKDNGQSDGLNRALQRCRGDIIGVLNADDEYLPQAASWAVEHLSKDPSLGVVYGRCFTIDSDGKVIGSSEGPDPCNYSRIFCCEDVIPAQAAFVRRSAWEAAGFYADVTRKTCPDYEMWVRLGLQSPMRYAPGFVARYRTHAGSEGQNVDNIHKIVQSKREVVDRMCNDSQAPREIRMLRRKAHGGIYHWSATHIMTIREKGIKFRVFKQLVKSALLYPNLRNIKALLGMAPPIVLPSFFWRIRMDVGEATRVGIRRIRETGRKLDRIFFFGLGYRFIYLPLKNPVKRVIRWATTAVRFAGKPLAGPLPRAADSLKNLWRTYWDGLIENIHQGVESNRQRAERNKKREAEWVELMSYLHYPGVKERWSRSISPGIPYGNGFHGDKYLVSLADFFLKQSRVFVETGAYLGLTAVHVAKNYPSVRVYTCDINKECVRFARSKASPLRNIRIEHQASPQFLYGLLKRFPDIGSQCATFWIDSHWDSYWPLQDEIELLTRSVTKGFIMIDDFKVPGRSDYCYDSYGGKECSFDLIKPKLAKGRRYRLIYPSYSQSDAAPILVQKNDKLVGVGILVVGFDGAFSMPEELRNFYSITDFLA